MLTEKNLNIGEIILRRPDPQAVWSLKSDKKLWNKADAWYHRSKSGGGKWEYLNKKLPERWTVNYRNLTFNIKPMGFKHTGLFPEQAVNWDWFSELIKKADRPIRVLNLLHIQAVQQLRHLKQVRKLYTLTRQRVW